MRLADALVVIFIVLFAFEWRKASCVCQVFSKMLDVKIQGIQRAMEVRQRAGIVVAGAADRCGHQRAHNKTPDWQINLIADHIKQYPTMKSHYCRQSSIYLDSKLTTSLRVTSVTRHVVFTMYACDE